MSNTVIMIAGYSLTDLVDGVVSQMDDELTAYKVAIVINGVFEAAGVEKRIPTQMMYIYTRNGLIVKGKKGKASEIRYTREEVAAFVVKYTSKHLQEFAVAITEQVEDENVEA